MSKIRVLHLGSPTGLYGAERWILALVKHLDRSRIESIVAVIKDHPSLEAPLCLEAEKLGVRSMCFDAHGKVNFSAIGMLKNYIRRNSIQIVHTHFYKTDIIGLLAARGTRCRTVTTPHGWSEKAGVKLWLYEKLDRIAFAFFDAVVPLSEGIHCRLKHFPWLKKRLHLILNGVDLSEVYNVTVLAEELVKWKKERNFVLGYIGQLIPRKGLDLLIKAFAMNKEKNWRLAIIGEGGSRGELEQMTKKLGVDQKVKFWGFRQDRISFLKAFDVFVLPSRLEGIPRCLMEAMALGVPVVATDIPGCTDLIENGKSGLLFRRENVEELVKKIAILENNINFKNRLASNAEKHVNKYFSAQRMAREYEKLYNLITIDVENIW